MAAIGENRDLAQPFLKNPVCAGGKSNLFTARQAHGIPALFPQLG
jgi:hypothetical protein